VLKLTNTFSKKERLTHKKQIDDLYLKGHSFFIYPLLIHWTFSTEKNLEKMPYTKVLIGASKKKLAKANQRNRVKRLVRESFRLNKNSLNKELKNVNKYIFLSIIYTSDTVHNYQEVESKILQVFLRLINNIKSEENEK